MLGALSPVISTSLLISGDRRGLDIEFSCVSNDSICNETSVKKKTRHWSSVDLPGWWTHGCARRVTHPDPRRRTHGSSAFETLPDLALCVFFELVLISILYNETLIISVVLFWVVGVVLMNYQTWRDYENLWICSQSVRSVGIPGTLEVWLASAVRVVLWRAEPSTCGVCINFRRLIPELNLVNSSLT